MYTGEESIFTFDDLHEMQFDVCGIESNGSCSNDAPEVEKDNDGQIVIYTGLFVWADGRIRYQPEE